MLNAVHKEYPLPFPAAALNFRAKKGKTKKDMEPWIAPHCTGGLGNRLFQLAAAEGLAERWNRPLVFFLPKCQFTDHGPFENIFKLFPSIPRLEMASEWETIKEPNGAAFRFLDMGATPPAGNCLLDGYRQSPRYFPKTGLQPDFEGALGADAWKAVQKRWKLLTPEERASTWFVHVRLGDYKILPHHQVDLNKYYREALDKVPPGNRILFFSDEPELCADIFRQLCQERDLEFVCFSEKDELVSMAAMSLCWGGAICANSTFSWWASYFGYQAAKAAGLTMPVFFPSKWGNGLPPPTDLFPSWAHKIDV
jgi:hypothetical protein